MFSIGLFKSRIQLKEFSFYLLMQLIVLPHDNFVDDLALRDLSRAVRVADAVLGAVAGRHDPLAVDESAGADLVDARAADFYVGRPRRICVWC